MWMVRCRGIWCIHPSFRIAALAEPPATGGEGASAQKWLNSEMLTMFFYHEMRDLTREEELTVLRARVRLKHRRCSLLHY